MTAGSLPRRAIRWARRRATSTCSRCRCSHNTGFTTFAIGLVQGHHMVLMPRFDPHEFLRLVTEHRVTFLATVPTIMQRLLPVYRADAGLL